MRWFCNSLVDFPVVLILAEGPVSFLFSYFQPQTFLHYLYLCTGSLSLPDVRKDSVFDCLAVVFVAR